MTLLILGVLAFVWALDVYMTPQVITDADGSPYLVRYFLWRPDWAEKFGLNPKKMGRIYLHKFLRSDHDRALHDHPWNFLSIILWRGYREHTTYMDVARSKRIGSGWRFDKANIFDPHLPMFKDVKAPAVLLRPANWRHRVELYDGKPAWTLVVIGPKVRSWGFWPGWKFCNWKNYDTSTGLCEEN